MPHLFSPEHTAVIYNPMSGTAKTKPLVKKMIALLEQRGYHVTRTERAGHATVLAEDAARAGSEAVIVIGGDGTLYESIARLPEHVRIAYFPGGSANLFALNMNLPQQPESWLQLLESGATVPVRFGLCNDRPWASVASAGFDAQVVAQTGTQLKRVLNQGAYAAQFLASLLTYEAPKFAVSIDGAHVEENVLGVMVSRGIYYGGAYRVFPHHDSHKSQLSYLILSGKFKWPLGKYAVGVLFQTLSTMSGVTSGTAQSIRVETQPPAYVQLDGDLYGTTPVTFSVESCERSVLAGNEK
jgi:YegS/Rv2252/BmrU family lipid kinase